MASSLKKDPMILNLQRFSSFDTIISGTSSVKPTPNRNDDLADTSSSDADVALHVISRTANPPKYKKLRYKEVKIYIFLISHLDMDI